MRGLSEGRQIFDHAEEVGLLGNQAGGVVGESVLQGGGINATRHGVERGFRHGVGEHRHIGGDGLPERRMQRGGKQDALSLFEVAGHDRGLGERGRAIIE